MKLFFVFLIKSDKSRAVVALQDYKNSGDRCGNKVSDKENEKTSKRNRQKRGRKEKMVIGSWTTSAARVF